MRTTVTLDADVQALVERLMRERGWTFKRALNEAVRLGLAPAARKASGSRTVARHLGAPRGDLTKALALAGELEDEALAGRLADGR